MMWTPLALSCLLAALAAALLTWQRHKYRHQARAAAQTALQDSLKLLELMGHLQQHRGMSSTWRSGDARFESRMLHKRQEIEQLLPWLKELARREESYRVPCFSHHELALFQFNWTHLCRELASLSVEEGIGIHGQLVEKVQGWLAAVGESRIEPACLNASMANQARNLTARLPALTEILGQSRAIGSGVAAQGNCSAVARVRLLFLSNRAQSLLERTRGALAGSGATSGTGKTVQQLLQSIRTDLLSGQPGISADQYFALATRAIDEVYGDIRQLGRQIDQALLQSGGTSPGGLQLNPV